MAPSIFSSSLRLISTLRAQNCRRMMSTGLNSPSPCLVLPPTFEGGSGDMVYNLYNLVQNKVIKFNNKKLIPQEDTRIVGSSHGWLALFNQRNCDLILTNPVTGRHVKLPPSKSDVPPKGFKEKMRCVCKVIISCDAEQEECQAMMIDDDLRLAFCRPGQSPTEWTTIGALSNLDCIGAIDGTHIPAIVRGRDVSSYRNRHGKISQNVLAACNFDLEFMYVLSGWEGSAHDSKVLNDAITRRNGLKVAQGIFECRSDEFPIEPVDEPSSSTLPVNEEATNGDDFEAWDVASDPPRLRWENRNDLLTYHNYDEWYYRAVALLGSGYTEPFRGLVFAEQTDQLFFVTRHIVPQMGPDGSSVDDRDYERYPYKTVSFDVHKVDWELDGGGGRLSHLDGGSLDGLAMFVGLNHSFAVVATEHNGLKPNSIYFTDDKRIVPRGIIDDYEKYGGHDIGIFDYKNKTISQCYYPCDIQSIKKIMPEPIWLLI
ncbi:hypothetical protein CASFOL_008050 [Castilleja foliolosa]|uniref:DUF295 domain-containing protein n=1 Tax=Castilleja foliolosa TaxID=1961234 RepID=A0ABD3DYF1_9LAMI